MHISICYLMKSIMRISFSFLFLSVFGDSRPVHQLGICTVQPTPFHQRPTYGVRGSDLDVHQICLFTSSEKIAVQYLFTSSEKRGG
jgi:hypothetical protein